MWKILTKCKTGNWKPLKFGVKPTVFRRKNASSGGEILNYELKDAFKTYKLSEAPPLTGSLTKNEAIQLYHQMSSIRRLETVCAALYREKEIRGFCHLYIGQEACAVGQYSVLSDNDTVITSYRCHGWAYIMGLSHESIIAELMGRKSGASRGKGGSMHIYCQNFYGGNGIVGGQVPLGTGIALALNYMNKDAVSVTIYGDGAANQGQIFESFNIACLKKLPTIFVCENNLYGMGTSTERSSCNADYYTRGDLIPGIWVDGMNVLAVRNATAFARKYALENGPILMELYTYRYHGHSMSDPGTSYRSREEVQRIRDSRDPLTLFKRICLDASFITQEEFDKIDDAIKIEVDAAIKNSKAEKEVDLKEIAGDIYHTNYEPKIRSPVAGRWLDHLNIAKRSPYTPKPPSKDQIRKISTDEKPSKSSPKPSPKPLSSSSDATSFSKTTDHTSFPTGSSAATPDTPSDSKECIETDSKCGGGTKCYDD